MSLYNNNDIFEIVNMYDLQFQTTTITITMTPYLCYFDVLSIYNVSISKCARM